MYLHNSLFFGGPSKLRQISFIEMRTYFSFGLTLRDIPISITPQTPSACSYSPVPARAGGSPLLPPPPPPTFSYPGQRNWRRPVPVPVTGVRYNSLF